jgi:hypothetical protein
MTFMGVLTQFVEWAKEEHERADEISAHDMPVVERIIRDDFDHFDDVYLRGEENWLMRQRTGRLCEEIVRHVLRK